MMKPLLLLILFIITTALGTSVVNAVGLDIVRDIDENTQIITTGSLPQSSASSTPPVTTTAAPSNNNTKHLSLQDWQLLIRSYEFLVGIERVAFDLCYDDFFTECLPFMQQDNSRLQLEWNQENYRCTPRWCACYDGVVRVYNNQTICLAPPITGGMAQLCHEVEICNPMRYRCADDFVYIQKHLPQQCQKFVNCTLNKNVITAATIQCSGDLQQCNTELACQVQKDPLNELPQPTTPAPWQFDNSLPDALRDIWIVTAAVFGLVLIVAVGAVVLMRHRQRQWDRWYEESNEMSLERADDVVWFEPEKEFSSSDSTTAETPAAAVAKNENENDPSLAAPAPRRPKDLSCIRCGSKNAPIQLLPCRCRWCGCAEPDSYSPPLTDTATGATTTTAAISINDELNGTTNASRAGSTSASSSRHHSPSSTNNANESSNTSDEPMVEVSSLSCRGVPQFTGKIKKSIMETYEERERQRAADSAAASAADDEDGVDPATAAMLRRRRQAASAAQKAKPPRPRCDRCKRGVNFCINFNSLYYPAASQEVSEDGDHDHHVEESVEKEEEPNPANFSPRQSADIDDDAEPKVVAANTKESENTNDINNNDDDDDTTPLTSSAAASPGGENPNSKNNKNRLTSTSLSRGTSSSPIVKAKEEAEKKKKMKIPTCCICLSEPCSVAIIPCGHVAQCPGCAKKLCVPVARADTERKTFVISAKCPLCRGDIVAMASLSKEQNQKAFEQSASAVE